MKICFLTQSQKFSFSCFFFKNAIKLHTWSVFSKKEAKPLHKYCPAAIRAVFSLKFVLDAKVQNSAFSNSSYLGVCCN